jgi:hypothetical protein
MNLRFILAALLCAFMFGSASAGTQTVDGEPCVLPGPQYVHSGASGVDRFTYWWCATRFNRYWSRSLDAADQASALIVDMSREAQAASSVGFLLVMPSIAWDDPRYTALDASITSLVWFDSNPPPIPPWRVQTSGKAKDRPGYIISEGKRSTTAASERVPVGVACGCREKAGRALEGKSVYCVVPGAKTPLLGALCTPGEATATMPEPPKPPPVVQPPVVQPPVVQPPVVRPPEVPPVLTPPDVPPVLPPPTTGPAAPPTSAPPTTKPPATGNGAGSVRP